MMKIILHLVLATTLTAAFAGTLAGHADAKKRASMSEQEKKALRKKAREYCTKTYVKGTSELERIEIKSDGKVICWIRN